MGRRSDNSRRYHMSSALQIAIMATLSWTWIVCSSALLMVRVDAFTSPVTVGRGISLKGDAMRISQFTSHYGRDSRPYYAVATEHASSSATSTPSSQPKRTASSIASSSDNRRMSLKYSNNKKRKAHNKHDKQTSSSSASSTTHKQKNNSKGKQTGSPKATTSKKNNKKSKQQINSKLRRKTLKYSNNKKGKAQNKSNTSTSSNIRPYSDPNTDELKQLTEYHLSQNIRPNGTISLGDMSPRQMHEFSLLLSSWSKITSSQRQQKMLAAEMAEQCLLELIEEKKSGNVNATKVITPDMYYLVIKAWLKVGNYKDLVHASSLLDLMERIHPKKERDEKFVKSSIKCYAAVLDAWCKTRSMGAEVNAEEILNRMGGVNNKKGKRNTGTEDGRDVRHYNNVMNRIATSGKPTAGVEAERLLDELIDSYKMWEKISNTTNNITTTVSSAEKNHKLAPNRNSFNTVIKAHANSNTRNAATNAKRILSNMEDPTSIGLQNLGLEPDKISYTSIIMALANGNNAAHYGEDSSDKGEQAEEMLEKMREMYQKGNVGVKPDTVTYNAVLKVWGKCGHPDTCERSEAILDKMIQLYEAGDADVIPDDVTFNSVIHNIANSNTANSPQRAMRLLERMEQSYESGGLIQAKPDIISYNSVLNAFAKCGGPESAQRAEEMLDNLEEKCNDSGCVWNIRPDVYSYNIVISAWGKCGDANKAVALLDRMRARMTNEGGGKADLKPDVTTYNSVLHAWSQSSDRNAPVKALGLLEIMLRLHECGDRGANPDVHSFSTVINAFSKSNYPRKARQTRDLLRRMKHMYDSGQKNMQPNIYVYAAVLNACAYTFGRAEEKEEALNIGIETYEELQQSSNIETNHVAYGSFIRVCRRLMVNDDSRQNHFITRAFRQCCSDGQLGEYVLRQLRAIPKLYVSLLQTYIVGGGDGGDDDYVEIEVVYQDLPTSWTCNVQDKNSSRGQKSRSKSRSPDRK